MELHQERSSVIAYLYSQTEQVCHPRIAKQHCISLLAENALFLAQGRAFYFFNNAVSSNQISPAAFYDCLNPFGIRIVR